MITLKNIALSGIERDIQSLINYSADKGINNIQFSNKAIFDVLSLHFSDIDKGEFLIDDTIIVPFENQKKFIYVLTVRSQNIYIKVCYLLDKQDRKEKTKNINNSFFNLKSLPLETSDDKNNKVLAIAKNIIDSSASYVLIDSNDEINSTNKTFIINAVNSLKDFLPVFILLPKTDSIEIEESTLDETEDVVVSTEIKQEENLNVLLKTNDTSELKVDSQETQVPSVKEEKPSTDSQKTNTSGINKLKIDGKFLKSIIKEYYITYLFIAAAALLISLFGLSFPYLLKQEKPTLGIIQLVGVIIVILLLLFVLISSSKCKLDKKFDKRLNKYYKWSTVVSFILGIIVGTGLFFALAYAKITVDITKYSFKYAIIAIIICGLSFIVVIFSTQIRYLILNIGNYFKSKKKKK